MTYGSADVCCACPKSQLLLRSAKLGNSSALSRTHLRNLLLQRQHLHRFPRMKMQCNNNAIGNTPSEILHVKDMICPLVKMLMHANTISCYFNLFHMFVHTYKSHANNQKNVATDSHKQQSTIRFLMFILSKVNGHMLSARASMIWACISKSKTCYK